ncbi:hypothetical protein ACFL9S_03500 [Erwinia sp. AnSW2-5]|uniref:hypothetical protein n=1 Tax=Erwinia sp. AnSW2-5 TaxID=3367692 RepID=UPI00385D81C3
MRISLRIHHIGKGIRFTSLKRSKTPVLQKPLPDVTSATAAARVFTEFQGEMVRQRKGKMEHIEHEKSLLVHRLRKRHANTWLIRWQRRWNPAPQLGGYKSLHCYYG